MSAATTQLRDDKVVHDSLPDIDSGIREGLDISHRDVLAAISLLSRLNKNVHGNVFRPGAFESQADAQS